MDGPIAARTWSGRAPRSVMAATAACTTPSASPRRPACTAATTPRPGSARRTGTQSATTTATPAPASATRASASATGSPSDDGGGPGTTATAVPWTCVDQTTGPLAHRARACRAASTRVRSSPTPRPRLACEPPAPRVVNPARTPGPRSTGSTSGGPGSGPPGATGRPVAATGRLLEEVGDVEVLVPATAVVVLVPRDLDLSGRDHGVRRVGRQVGLHGGDVRSRRLLLVR